jgi:cysteine peptidase C
LCRTGRMGWQPTLYTDTATMTKREAKRKLGHVRLSTDEQLAIPFGDPPTLAMLAALPESWDPRKDGTATMCWKGTFDRVVDQGQCGACFAFASSFVFSMRQCLNTSGRINIAIAEQSVVSCLVDYSNLRMSKGVGMSGTPGAAANGCDGGNPIQVWLAMQADGRSVRTCNEYVAKPGTEHPCGTNMCTKPLLYKTGTKVTQVKKKREALQAELFGNGPVYAGITCYSDLFAYKGGVYAKSASATDEGCHAVSVIGWGTDEGKFYWIVSNSWVLRVIVALSLSLNCAACRCRRMPTAVCATAQAWYAPQSHCHGLHALPRCRCLAALHCTRHCPDLGGMRFSA